MLEYFSYKKWKDYRAKRASAVADENQRVLDPRDEKYFEKLADNESKEVPLQPPQDSSSETLEGSSSTKTSVFASKDNNSSSSAKNGKSDWTNWQGWIDDMSEWKDTVVDKAKQVQMPNMPNISNIPQMPNISNMPNMPNIPSMPNMPAFMQKKEGQEKKDKKNNKEYSKDGKKETLDVSEQELSETSSFEELTQEEKELHEVLERLNLAADGGNAFCFSDETKALFKRFVQILKDIVNGVPTAYDDLIKLFESSSEQIEKLFQNVPNFLKKMVFSFPPITEPTGKIKEGGVLDYASRTAAFTIPALREFIKKPGMVSASLRSILNVLKTRFPALIGTNALMSMALFVLLFVFWYAYKRGKETRLEKERLELEDSLKIEAKNTTVSDLKAEKVDEATASHTEVKNEKHAETASSTSVSDVPDSSARGTKDDHAPTTKAGDVKNTKYPPPPEPAASLKELAR